MGERGTASQKKTLQSPLALRFRGFLPVVVDVETAGFNARTDALLEMAISIIEMDEQGHLYPGEVLAVNVEPFQGANLEKSALDFTGIDPWHPFREAVPESEALAQLLKPVRKAVKSEGCNRAILVGHNAFFDHSFLMSAVQRTNYKRNPFHAFSTLDTAALSALAYGHTVLSRACQIAGIEFSNQEAHSAAYDTLKTAELFCEIVNRWKSMGGWPVPGHEDEETTDP